MEKNVNWHIFNRLLKPEFSHCNTLSFMTVIAKLLIWFIIIWFIIIWIITLTFEKIHKLFTGWVLQEPEKVKYALEQTAESCIISLIP